MTRHRYVFIEGEMVEVSPDQEPSPNRHDALLYNDRLYQDDGDPRYHSRSSHREYMKRHDLAMACDYTETWARAAKEREARLAGADPSRKHDIADVVYGRMPLSKPHGREDDPL